ncbi:MAG: hypothetical protein ACREHD_22040, partial [Pirellulales bacterium]
GHQPSNIQSSSAGISRCHVSPRSTIVSVNAPSGIVLTERSMILGSSSHRCTAPDWNIYGRAGARVRIQLFRGAKNDNGAVFA